MVSEDGAVKFTLKGMKIQNDAVWHIGVYEPEDSSFSVDQKVKCHVDEDKRRIHARVHSAGHLLDIAMMRAGRSDLKPSKGFHFATGAYVEYIGNIDQPDREPLIKKLNEVSKDIIENTPEDMNVWKKMCSYEEANEALEKAGGCPPYIKEGSILRVLKLTEDDWGCPCGGTHVGHVADIKGINITKIQKKGKAFRVSYSVA
jgi:Ser-tRNA(Ala) deacylase AlaX